jgi:hypothetical protein
MTIFKKLDQIRAHLRPEHSRVATLEGGKRVQKNLSILESDAERLTVFAKRDGLSQARLLSAALDAYSAHQKRGLTTETNSAD